MPVKRRAAKTRIGAVPELEWSILTDQLAVEDVPGWEGYCAQDHQAPGALAVPTLGDYWLAHGEEITADWIAESPGTRPSFWWKFSAPRWGDFDPIMAEPRKQIGGSGHPASPSRSDEGRNDLLAFDRGVPRRWKEVDASDPPLVEAQATYLERHGLFHPGERRRIRKDAFLPVAVKDA